MVANERDRRLRVLVIDDQPLLRKGLASVLQAHGGDVSVCEASDLEGAVEAACSCRPDLIVLDADLGGLDPGSVIPVLEEAVPRAKVVVMSVRESIREARGAFAAGADGYVSKQADLAELEHALGDVEHGGKYLDPRLGALLAAEDMPARPDWLTPRQQRVLELVARGMTNREIASELGLSLRTVEANRARAQQKLRLRTRADVVAYVRGR